jgi:hypothetical protein
MPLFAFIILGLCAIAVIALIWDSISISMLPRAEIPEIPDTTTNVGPPPPYSKF